MQMLHCRGGGWTLIEGGGGQAAASTMLGRATAPWIPAQLSQGGRWLEF